MFNFNYFSSFEFREVISSLEERKDKVNDLIQTFEENNSFSQKINIINAYKFELKLIEDTINKIKNTHYFE